MSMGFFPALGALLVGLAWCSGGAHRFRGGAGVKNCQFEILMVDDRPWRRIGVHDMPHWASAAVLNLAYAERHGYQFRLVRPLRAEGKPMYPGWNKVMYVAEMLRKEADEQQACKWILYLDADALVRDHAASLPSFLGALASRYALREDLGVIFAREPQDPEFAGGTATRGGFLNTGVFLVRVGHPGRTLFDAWLEAGRSISSGTWLLANWPGEQGILSELLAPGTYPQGGSAVPAARRQRARRAVAVINTTEMNSPDGVFVKHAWGLTAVDQAMRHRTFEEALLKFNASDPAGLARLRRAALVRATPWRAESF